MSLFGIPFFGMFGRLPAAVAALASLAAHAQVEDVAPLRTELDAARAAFANGTAQGSDSLTRADIANQRLRFPPAGPLPAPGTFTDQLQLAEQKCSDDPTDTEAGLLAIQNAQAALYGDAASADQILGRTYANIQRASVGISTAAQQLEEATARLGESVTARDQNGQIGIRTASANARAAYGTAADLLETCPDGATQARDKVGEARNVLAAALGRVDANCNGALNALVGSTASGPFFELENSFRSLGDTCELEYGAYRKLAENSTGGNAFDRFASLPDGTVPSELAPPAGGATAGVGDVVSPSVAPPAATADLPESPLPVRLLGRALASLTAPITLLTLPESGVASVPTALAPAYAVNRLVLENLESGAALGGFERLTRRIHSGGGLRYSVMVSTEVQRKALLESRALAANGD